MLSKAEWIASRKLVPNEIEGSQIAKFCVLFFRPISPIFHTKTAKIFTIYTNSRLKTYQDVLGATTFQGYHIKLDGLIKGLWTYVAVSILFSTIP